VAPSLNSSEKFEKSQRSQSVEAKATDGSSQSYPSLGGRNEQTKDEKLLSLFDSDDSEVKLEKLPETKQELETSGTDRVDEVKVTSDTEDSKSQLGEVEETSKPTDKDVAYNTIQDNDLSANQDIKNKGGKELVGASIEETLTELIKEESPRTKSGEEGLGGEEESKIEDTKESPSNERQGDHSNLRDHPESSPVKQSNKEDAKLMESYEETQKDEIATDQKTVESPVAASFDTSALSPVGSPISDTNIIRGLNLIDEHENGGAENDGDISEAETIITEGTATLEKGKSFLRKEKDEHRRKLKRKVIYSSDEDDFDEKDDETLAKESPSPKPASPKPNANTGQGSLKVNTKDAHSTIEDHLNDTEVSGGETDDHNENKSNFRKKDYKIKRDSTGRSFLQRACKKGDLQEVKNLIERGADANECDFGGFTCLHEAALAGHTEIVKYLIEQGANVNKQALEFGDFETPLMDAAENKHIETVKLLLAHGADPDICNADGYSALTKLYHLQDEEEDYEEIIALLDAASQVGGKSSLQAVSQSSRRIIEDPTESYFADLVRKKTSATIFRYLAQGLKEAAAGDFVTHAYSLQKTPDILNVAARNGHVELVDILLGLNPGSFDINQTNRIGVTALLATVGRGHYEVVKFLLSKGANPKLKRDQDGLNALQVAKHSAQHDPREVILLEQYIRGQIPKDPSTPQPNEVEEDANMDVDDEISSGPIEKKRRASEDHGGPVKRAKSGEPEPKAKEQIRSHDHKSKEAPFKNEDSKEMVTSKQSLPEVQKPETQVFKKELTADSREVSPAYDQGDYKRNKQKGSASASPVPLTKAQEEQKIKAAEEAKHWQEKVQAKKRARREMFLLAEKEKEKKRKEEEEKKMEEMKQQKQKEVEEKLKEAKEAERLLQEIEKKRQTMEIQSVIQKYPIGLQEASFNGSISDNERLKFSPLYVFEHGGDSWVVDLQIALLLAAPVSDIHKHCNMVNSAQIPQPAKEAMWPLFFHMVGVGRHDRVDSQGCAKFKMLDLRYLKLNEVTHFVREQYPEVDSLIWKNGKLTRVKLEIKAESSQPLRVPPVNEKPNASGFIPPKWRQRPDVLKTIQSASVPLW